MKPRALVLILVLLLSVLALRAQAPEGAMGHDATTLPLSCRIARGPVADVQFYRVICGGPESFVIAVDRHAMLARWLGGRVGQRVPITFGEAP